MKNYLIGFFDVEGVGPDTAETLLTGNPVQDYATLSNAIKKKYPKIPYGSFRRTSSIVERRDEKDPGHIEETPGMTLRQIFKMGEDGNEEPTRRVGRVSFNGALSDIFLLYVHARGTIGVSVRPLLKSEGVANFQTQINPQRSVSELPSILKELFGDAGKELKLFLRKPAVKL